MKRLVTSIIVLIIGSCLGVTGTLVAASETQTNSKGKIMSETVVFDSADFNILTTAFETGKQESYDNAIEQVMANPEDFGIVFKAFETYESLPRTVTKDYDVVVAISVTATGAGAITGNAAEPILYKNGSPVSPVAGINNWGYGGDSKWGCGRCHLFIIKDVKSGDTFSSNGNIALIGSP